MERPFVQAISFTFDEGVFFDLWMIVHLLAGAVIGFIVLYLCLEQTRAYIYASIALVMWELFEISIGIYEVFTNRILDIAIGMIGTALVFSFFVGSDSATKKDPFVLTSILLVVTALLGWFSFIIPII